MNRIFFSSDSDLITVGSQEHEDFWKFLRKFQALEQSRGSRSRKSNLTCFKLLPDDPQDLLNRIPFQDQDYEGHYLSESLVKDFQRILTLYVDFLQREKFAKLKKLRKSQANLPIAEYRSQLLDTVEKNRVVIIAGDTGCGKSTQVPQYLLQAGYTNIACTQPRRLACIALAKRVGFETLNEYGNEIGYQIRFEKKKSAKTRVLFLTEGLLLRQITSDPSLSGYNVIVLDEVHERHLHADFLLGVVKCLLQQRHDLKVILMSATINITLFQDYFSDENAPVVQVPGRLYPIKVQYFPIAAVEQSSSSEKLNPAPYVRILQMIDAKYPDKERGDLLIFLSGIREITTVVDACKEYAERNQKWIVLALHSTLSLADQDKVFDYPPEGVRKCIVSTNIAETSITIDGVRFVVDSGKAKEMQYDPVCKMQRLKENWVSRASAEQRKGRSGRTGPGICFRLFSEAEFNALSAYSTPEIHRVPLDTIVLQMVSMGLPDVRKFPFIEPPPPESLEHSILVLKAQDALAEDESLTVTGKMLSRLPVDVTIGKMLIMGTLFHQVDAVLSLAAALSVQSPFTNNAYRDADCVAARRNMDSDHGDPMTLLNAYRQWLEIKTDKSENSRKWCRKRGLEEQRFYEMTKLGQQFKDLLGDAGLLKTSESSENLSSAERSARHGQMKQLRDLKKEYHKMEGSSKKTKKFLKMRDMDTGNDDNEEDDNLDIKDIEFRMKNDGLSVQSLLNSWKTTSYKDLTVLKLIVTSGLYPQVAIADEFNHAKSGSEQLFHTKVKPFNVLHPNSIFAASPEYLALDSIDIVANMGKFPVSAKHQLLVYVNLLETNKPYLINTMRMPALQTLMLFSRHVDTNSDMSRLVFDSWIEVRFSQPLPAQLQVLRAFKLRSLWNDLLTLKMQDTLSAAMTDQAKQEAMLADLESRLSKGLLEFMHTETLHCQKRLLPGDLKVMYYSSCASQTKDQSDIEANPFGTMDDVQVNESKGGLDLLPYLTYDCLVGDELVVKSCFEWECLECQEKRYSSCLQRLSHVKECWDKHAKEQHQEQIQENKRKDPNSQEFHCRQCNKTLWLTMTEILRHKKSHR